MSDPYLRPKHTCGSELKAAGLKFSPGRVKCSCGAIWGPIDRHGGRTRINEDGTPWVQPLAQWVNVDGPCDECGGEEFEDWSENRWFGVCKACGHCCGHKGPLDTLEVQMGPRTITVERDDR